MIHLGQYEQHHYTFIERGLLKLYFQINYQVLITGECTEKLRLAERDSLKKFPFK